MNAEQARPRLLREIEQEVRSANSCALGPEGQPKISQTHGVWYAVRRFVRPEGTLECVWHPPFLQDGVGLGRVTRHLVPG
jgi:hypothetical protein